MVVGTAVGAGALLGPLDLAGQVHSPYPWADLFNSPAVWAAAAFAFGAWSRSQHLASIVMVLVAVETYYFADVVVRGADRSNLTSPTAGFWLALGVGAGLVFGTAGSWMRSSVVGKRRVAAALLPAVYASEAVLRIVRHVTVPPGAGSDDELSDAAILAAIALVSLAIALRRRDRHERWRVVAVATAFTAAGSLAYVMMST